MDTQATDARPQMQKNPARGNDTRLTTDGGKPVERNANRGSGDTSSPAGIEAPEGSLGQTAGKNQEQDALIRGMPCSG